MRKFGTVCFILLVLFNIPAVSQEASSKGAAVKIRNFISEKDRIILKEFYTLGAIKGAAGNSIEIFALVAYEPGKESERLRGLKIAVTNPGSDMQISSAYLDYDEVDDFIKSVVYMIQIASTWKFSAKDSSEIMFLTRDNFRFGFFQKDLLQSCFAEYSGNAGLSGSFDIEDLKTVKLILDKGKAILSIK